MNKQIVLVIFGIQINVKKVKTMHIWKLKTTKYPNNGILMIFFAAIGSCERSIPVLNRVKSYTISTKQMLRMTISRCTSSWVSSVR